MDSASGRLSAALLLTKNKGRDTIKKECKTGRERAAMENQRDSVQNAAEKRAAP